jgi:predicted AlkP superfamily phosphohydrolase/phosphomutase
LAHRHPLEIPGTKAVTLPNNRCAAVRLNLVGREPNGCVHEGEEADALLAHLAETLYDLRHVETGERIVTRVDLARDLHGPDHHPDLPDLTVAFRRDLGPLEACESPRYGRISQAIYKSNLPRSGDHTDSSRLWLVGPGIGSDTRLRTGGTLDVTPTVLSLLGLAYDDLPGEPLLEPAHNAPT